MGTSPTDRAAGYGPLLRNPTARLLLCGFAALYWELALIRWLSSCVRIVAYFSNFVLIAAFFGLGAGALLTSRRLRLQRGIVPMLALAILIGLALSGFHHPNPQSPDEYIWIGAPLAVPVDTGKGWLGLAVVLPAVYAVSAAVFVIFGEWIGQLFEEHEPLWGYSVEIGGSVLGIAAFALLSHLQVGPMGWFGLGFVILIPLLQGGRVALGLAAISAVAAMALTAPFAGQFTWSPYYRIFTQPLTMLFDRDAGTVQTFDEPLGHTLSVNNDYHQMIVDLRERPDDLTFQAEWRALYDAPYRDIDKLPAGPILVVGAGTGNDVSAALRRTNREVHAVEIDPGIVALGRRLHPEKPYANPRVKLTVNDARNFFQRAEHKYALVVFGFLDSHTLLSSFSSLRLDNFVYTRESLQQVRRILAPGGRVALTFASNRDWIHARFQTLIAEVFGGRTEVIKVTDDKSSYANGVVYVSRVSDDPPVRVGAVGDPLPEDDWPFLYLRKPHVAGHYQPFLALVVLLGLASLLLLPRGQRQIRLPYFFLGAAFFLVETSNVISLSLLYGSTWTVNVTVFTGVLVLVLLGNLTVAKTSRPLLKPAFALLAVSVLVAWATPTSVLLELSHEALRAPAAVAVFLGPVYFASIVFATLIRTEERMFAAYGSNILGAVVGGASEYLSMVHGFKFLLLVTFGLYLLAWLTLRAGGGQAARRAPMSS